MDVCTTVNDYSVINMTKETGNFRTDTPTRISGDSCDADISGSETSIYAVYGGKDSLFFIYLKNEPYLSVFCSLYKSGFKKSFVYNYKLSRYFKVTLLRILG